MTQDESILEYVLTLVSTLPGVSSAVRSRVAPIDRAEGVVISLKPEEAPVEIRGGAQYGSGLQLINLTFVVTIVGRGTVPDQVIDPVRQALHARLMADRTLGNRCAMLLMHSTKWDFETADQTAVVCEQRYIARYQTTATDISAAQ